MSDRFLLSSKLPPYVFNITNELKAAARARGEDIVDLGMGNPDLPTPTPIVNKLIEAARNPRNHRYSASRGIPPLREAIADRYLRKWGVRLDPGTEVVQTIGAKEGLAHMIMTVLAPGETAVVPVPAYPIHTHSVAIANGRLIKLPADGPGELLDRLAATIRAERPKVVTLSFPNNPTTMCVDLKFFEEVVALAREYGTLVIHDFAYADLVFDGYVAPSILQVEGAKEVAVELFSLSKSYSMAGWRMGFVVGNPEVVAALTRVKSYLDYGTFQPIQIAAIIALNQCEEYVGQIAETYRKRRDVLIDTFARAGWELERPAGTMFVWARIPERYRAMGSLEFAKHVLARAKVGVSPGVGFGEAGDGHVRFALIENEHRIRQAARGIKQMFRED
ncbi:MAG TPA: aminotransferase class I/II-fold pyridoxal phosphate-dependent enzyme [Blastocatellia bacterium]|nr:aminotransferase class I/II-fold pyridoxal phosphate-dependent enzyme [Blastocatellia bacterium]